MDTVFDFNNRHQGEVNGYTRLERAAVVGADVIKLKASASAIANFNVNVTGSERPSSFGTIDVSTSERPSVSDATSFHVIVFHR